jgi:hypothetical protein
MPTANLVILSKNGPGSQTSPLRGTARAPTGWIRHQEIALNLLITIGAVFGHGEIGNYADALAHRHASDFTTDSDNSSGGFIADLMAIAIAVSLIARALAKERRTR